jgi:hypothetical protein
MDQRVLDFLTTSHLKRERLVEVLERLHQQDGLDAGMGSIPRNRCRTRKAPPQVRTGSVEAVAGTVTPQRVAWRIVASLSPATATAPWGFACSGAPRNL